MNMKKKKELIILLVVFLIFLVIFNTCLFLLNIGPKLELKREVFTYEYGEKVSAMIKDYIKKPDKVKANYELKFDSSKLKIKDGYIISRGDQLLKVGKHKVKLINGKRDINFIIQVKDTRAPKIITSYDKIVLEQSSKDVDLTNFFAAEDISGVELKIRGNYDLNKIGEYKLFVIASDHYKNEIKKEFVLQIVDFDRAKNDGVITKDIDGKIYKSEKMLNYEENKESNQNNSDIKNQSSSSTESNSTNNIQDNHSSTITARYRTDIANSYINQINAYRRENGLLELPVTSEAQNEANMRAKQLVDNYSHNASYGFGENIGRGSAGVDFFIGWKNSPSHNAAMLREQNTAMAVSVYETGGIWYAVTSFKMNY